MKNLQNVWSLDLLARQSKVGSKCTVQSGQEEAGTDVGEEANGGLGHGKHGVLSRNAEGRVDGETDTTTHGDAIHEGHIGLGVCCDQVIELVFQGKVILRRLLASRTSLVGLSKGSNIAASTEGSSLTLDNNHVGQLALLPLLQPRHNLPCHASIERIELLGSVQGDGAHAVLVAEPDIVRLVSGEFFDVDGGSELLSLAVS